MNVRRIRGFSIIELLIGVAISLLGLVAVGTMMSVFAGKRAGITQTLAAQDNGVMALYRLERDLGQAGYGLMPLRTCATIENGLSPAFTPFAVVIQDGGSGASDAIAIKGTNPASGIPGTELDSSSGTSMTGSQYNVRSSIGFAVGDLVAATNSCVLTPITSVSATAIGYSYTPALSSSSADGYLVYFGQPGEFFNRQYAIGGTGLTVADYPGFITNTLVDNIVFMKAQYGLSNGTGSTEVNRWASGSTTLDVNVTTCSGTSVNPACVVAVRVGVVAASSVRANEVIEQASQVMVLPAVLDSTGTEIGGLETFDVTDTRTRYRAYSTIIALKNVIWLR